MPVNMAAHNTASDFWQQCLIWCNLAGIMKPCVLYCGISYGIAMFWQNKSHSGMFRSNAQDLLIAAIRARENLHVGSL